MNSERFILLVIFLVGVPSVLSQEVDPLCEGLPEDEIIPLPHPTNCSLFYECYKGNKTLFACDEGLYYNNKTQSCDFASSSGCLNLDPKCENVTLDYLPHPSNCSLYYECYHGYSYVMRCPSGYWFSAASKICVPPDESDCVETTTPWFTTPLPQCFGVRPNQTVLSRYEGDCRKYWKCTGAVLTEEQCPSGLLFDEGRQMCDFADEVDCDDTTRTPDPSTETPPTTAGTPTTPAEVDPRCVDDDGISYWPHAVECGKYVECYYGVSFEMDCPTGLYFSDEQKKCVQPSESECGRVTTEPGTTSERPSGWTSDPDCPWPESEGKLLPYPGDCTQYYECASGVKVAMPCPAGLWFNVDISECDYPYQTNCEWGTLSFMDYLYRFLLY